MSESEDRTQAPSKRRRQQARERGLVARSPELTAAVGLMAAVALLGAWGDDLAGALVTAIREPWQAQPSLAADPALVVEAVRRAALEVAQPLGAILGGVLVAVVAAHQAQVGGLWVPGLLAPDPGRLWGGFGFGGGGGSADLGSRLARGTWSLLKTAVVLAVAAGTIRAHREAFEGLDRLEPHALVQALGGMIQGLALRLALALVVLGLIDLALQWRRFEARLRATPEESREDRRELEGDPDLRARRRRIARAWRFDPAEVLAGATLAVAGSDPADLLVVLTGGPPPRRVRIRVAVAGPAGSRLRRSIAARGELPTVSAPDLARRLARWARATPGRSLPDDLLADLVPLWPSRVEE